MVNILGIDPGFEKVGFAVCSKPDSSVREPKLISSILIKTRKSDTISQRLYSISKSLENLIREFHIEEIAMEQLFFFKNAKTVIGVAQAQGAMMLIAEKDGIPLTFLTPLQIKSLITGYGTADKASVEKMLSILLGNELKVADDDETDAIACAYAYCLFRNTFDETTQ